MEIQSAIRTVKGTGIVVRGNDIDTDQIIPARFMKVVTFSGLGQYAFYDERFDEDGTEKPHPFNASHYQGASILFANRNFGCGSSREHAPQALMRYGIRAVVAESFGEIFAGNCTVMGIPTVTLNGDIIRDLMAQVEANPKTAVEIDLPASQITVGKLRHTFSMQPAYRNALIAGSWDSTSVLLENVTEIKEVAEKLPYVTGFGAA